jgi:hypothetical protein
MELLTPFQQQLIKSIGGSPIRDQFYLTGGTALSAFYLTSHDQTTGFRRTTGFFLSLAQEIIGRIDRDDS